MNHAVRAAKLNALIRNRWGATDGTTGNFPDGAVVASRQTGWVLVGEDGRRRLGAALAWARQQHIDDLHVLAESPDVASVLARRASQFSRPPTVWRIDGANLTLATPAAPAEFAHPLPSAEAFRPLLRAAGVETTVEQGELVAEWLGLEVGRVVADPNDPSGASSRLEVGVGRFDREAFAMMNAELADPESLAKAVKIVSEIRRPGTGRHPLNQLAPERWLRAAVMADPSLVGAAVLNPVESAVARENLKDPAPATAVGTDTSGQPLVVVCSAGVDLDLVPSAADDRLAHSRNARLVLALPGRDVMAVTEELAVALVKPATIVRVSTGWSTEE